MASCHFKIRRRIFYMLNRSAGLLAMACSLVFGGALTACASRANAPAMPHASPSTASQLQAFQWTLDSASDGQGQAMAVLFPHADRRFVMEFMADRMAVSGGCNSLGGNYRTVDASTLEVGPLMGTRKACEAPLMEADKAISALLAQPLQLLMAAGSPPVLRLVSRQGQTLVWTGTPKL